jgi:Trypsin-co-occurring domain 1
MKRFVEFPLEGGGSVLVETDAPGSGPVTRGGPADAVERAAQTFESTLHSVRDAARTLLEQMHDLPRQPESVQVQFGVKLSGKLGAVLTTVSGEANFVLQMTWNRPHDA